MGLVLSTDRSLIYTTKFSTIGYITFGAANCTAEYWTMYFMELSHQDFCENLKYIFDKCFYFTWLVLGLGKCKGYIYKFHFIVVIGSK